MRDQLERMNPYHTECAIINIDSSKGSGTHWVAYVKRGEKTIYYDSLGDLEPPIELRQYLAGSSIHYNFEQEQKSNTVICGHLCLKFLVTSHHLISK